MNATIVNERLSRLDLALVLRRVMIVDALHVVPRVSRIGDNVIVNENKRHFTFDHLGDRTQPTALSRQSHSPAQIGKAAAGSRNGLWRP